MTRRIVFGQSVVAWVAQKTDEYGNFGASIGMGVEDDGKLIAGVVFADYNGVNICMHVASDGSKRWLTKEFLRLVFDYAFNQAKVKRITGLVGEGNEAARKFDQHVGFTLETRLKDAHPSGDLLVYVMRREDCRWLGKTPLLSINERVSHELRKAA